MSSVTVPTVGSRIEIELYDRIGPNMIPPRPSFREFKGEVLPSYRWLTDREFCMTGDDSFPVRIINVANIRNLRITSGSSRTVNTQTKVYKISGSKGTTYTVTRNSSGWHCECKGFTFRGRCRHIEEAQNS